MRNLPGGTARRRDCVPIQPRRAEPHLWRQWSRPQEIRRRKHLDRGDRAEFVQIEIFVRSAQIVGRECGPADRLRVAPVRIILYQRIMTLIQHLSRRLLHGALSALCFGLPAPASAFELPDWSITNLRDHPLVGTVWDANGVETTLGALAERIRAADHVAIGEIHINADHHRIQAAILDMLAADGRKPSVVFEMIPERLGGELQAFQREHPSNAAGLGDRLEWTQRGWPDWSIYRPIAEAALRHGLTMAAGDLDRTLIRAIGKGGSAALEPARRQRYRLDRPLDPQTERALRKTLDEGHCGLLPQAALAPMLTVQRARDGALADAMISANNPDGTVLIAGAGHVRRDWGAPAVLMQRTQDKQVLAIALFEVGKDRDRLQDYPLEEGGAIPFDFVVFTPRAETGDPCAGLKERFKGKPPVKD